MEELSTLDNTLLVETDFCGLAGACPSTTRQTTWSDLERMSLDRVLGDLKSLPNLSCSQYREH